MHDRSVAIAALLAALARPTLGARHEAARHVAPACASAEHRQFDFFAGDWDAYDVGAATPTARNHVTPMVDGCALREVYEQRDGLRGESFSTYDAARRLWHQSWVTNRGQLLLLEGRLDAGRMVLNATDRTESGVVSLVRVVWWPEGTTVRETATRSTDGGRSWTPLFDMVFRHHR